ncbi:MAG: DUF2145 domain-containing protein [Pseudomonadota bacterium]
MIMRIVTAIAAAALLATPAVAQSRPFDSTPRDIAQDTEDGFLSAEDAALFSKQIERDLAARGARVALVFRSGRPRDELPEGVRYTHGAFWVYQPLQAADGTVFNGYAVYNLYVSNEDPDGSYLHQDFPFDFTRPMSIPEAGVIIPVPELQRRVLQIMASPTYEALHQDRYSLISNPHELSYQNCNEFMLDVIAAALWETDDRAQLKVNLEAHFDAAEIETNLFERLFAPMVDSRLKTDDHRGGIRTTTYLSMARFMDQNGYAVATYELGYDDPVESVGSE